MKTPLDFFRMRSLDLSSTQTPISNDDDNDNRKYYQSMIFTV